MAMDLHIDEFSDPCSPLDLVEDVLVGNGWVFQRAEEGEILLTLEGKQCNYHVFFMWQEEMRALQIACQYDLDIAKPFSKTLYRSLAQVNEKLWLGHFDVPAKSGKPCFRHTCLLRGAAGSNAIEQIEDLIDFSLQQCERYFSVFQLLAVRDHAPSNDVVNLALMEIKGEA